MYKIYINNNFINQQNPINSNNDINNNKYLFFFYVVYVVYIKSPLNNFSIYNLFLNFFKNQTQIQPKPKPKINCYTGRKLKRRYAGH